jgi:hypothetical protein
MDIEKQVCSLELAKRLKELGVKQESLFYYQNNPYNNGKDCIDLMIVERSSINNENVIMNTQCENEDNPKYSAFTVAELGEMLPILIKDGSNLIIWPYLKNDKKVWDIDYNGHEESDETFVSDTEADARAQMLIYLIENGLV